MSDVARTAYSPGVSIIIPNYNGRELLRRNLPSVLEASGEYGGESEIIVVDDASSDGSVSFLSETYPHCVRVVRHDRNRGFGAACLSGVKEARFPLLLFLNTDVYVLGEFLAPLVPYFLNPTTFSVSPLIFSEAGELQHVSFRIPYLRKGRIHYRRLKWEEQLTRLPRPLITLWGSGGSLLVEKEKFLTLGGFDPFFLPFYREDADLGVRAWRRGWRCYVECCAGVIHPSGRGAIASEVDRHLALFLRRRNSFFFEKRHAPGKRAAPWRCAFFRSLRDLLKGKLSLRDWRRLLGELWRLRKQCALPGTTYTYSVRQVADLFSEYYGPLPKPPLSARVDERHRERKKRQRAYHGILELGWAEKLRACFPKAAVVDLGCGTRKFPGAIGMDLFRNRCVDLICDLDHHPWPLADSSCDILIASHVLEHVRNVRGFLRQCLRVLKPGGVFIARCPHFSARDSFRNPEHLRHLTYDALGEIVCSSQAEAHSPPPGKIPLVVGETQLLFRGGIRARVGRCLAARNARTWEQYWSRIFPAREICWVIRKPCGVWTAHAERAPER